MQKILTIMALLCFTHCSHPSTSDEPLSLNLPMITLKNFERNLPTSQKPEHVIHNVQKTKFFAAVTYTGRFQAIQARKFEFLDVRMNTEEELNYLFRRLGSSADDMLELLIQESNRDYWVPVARDVLAKMRAELKPGEKIRAELQHFGSIYREQVYVLWDYDRRQLKGPTRMDCFTQSLWGIKLGDSFQATIEKLREKYPPPASEAFERGPLQKDSESTFTTVVEPHHGLNITIANSGIVYGKKLFSIRLSGSPEGDTKTKPILFNGFQLGSSRELVIKAFGEPSNEKRVGEVTVLTFKKFNPDCHLEIQGNKLSGVKITEDPNYFSE